MVAAKPPSMWAPLSVESTAEVLGMTKDAMYLSFVLTLITLVVIPFIVFVGCSIYINIKADDFNSTIAHDIQLREKMPAAETQGATEAPAKKEKEEAKPKDEKGKKGRSYRRRPRGSPWNTGQQPRLEKLHEGGPLKFRKPDDGHSKYTERPRIKETKEKKDVEPE